MTPRDPFILPAGLNKYPAGFKLFEHRMDFELGEIWTPEGPSGAFSLGSFGALWLDSLGGLSDARRLIRRAFEGKMEPETVFRLDPLRARRPLLRLTGPDPDEIWMRRTIQGCDQVDLVAEGKLSLLASILLSGGEHDPDTGAAIRMALDVENLADRRDDAMRQAMWAGLLQGRGITGERALRAITQKTRWKTGTVRANRDRPFVKAVMAAFAGSGTLRIATLPHLADSWFAADQERHVAIGIAYRALECIKRGEVPAENLRWSILVLCEGHWRRHRALPFETIYALAACLGLLTGDGLPRRDLALAGVKPRAAFIEYAGWRAGEEFDGGDLYEHHERSESADLKTEAEWAWHPFHIRAKEHVRQCLRARLQGA